MYGREGAKKLGEIELKGGEGSKNGPCSGDVRSAEMGVNVKKVD